MFGLYSVKFSALQLIACLLMRPEMTIPRFNGAIGSTSDQEVPGSIPAGSCAFFLLYPISWSKKIKEN